MFDPSTTVFGIEQPLAGDVSEFEERLREIGRVRSWLSNKHAETVRSIALIESARDARTGPKRARERVKDATGCTEGEAKRATCRAEQFDSMCSTSKGLAAGEISSANAGALAKLRESLRGESVAGFDEAEAHLASLAASQSTDEFRATLRDWAHGNSGDDGISDSQRRRDRRKLSMFTGEDQMGILRADLDPESAETVRRAVTDVATEMWHRAHTSHREGAPNISKNQRLMADALVELCRRGSTVTADGARRNRPTVIVTMTLEQLLSDLAGAGVSTRLADGTPIPAAMARRLACDADLLPVVFGGTGQPLDVGRSRRLASDAQRSALRAIHPTCAAKGCDRPYDWCDIHHVNPWQSGGSTDLDNLVPLCTKHHHLVHEGGWTFTRQPNSSVKFHPKPDRPATKPPNPPTKPRAEKHSSRNQQASNPPADEIPDIPDSQESWHRNPSRQQNGGDEDRHGAVCHDQSTLI